ncbi:MAG: AMP-binding protein [Hungatella sp.]|jgi:long-chain acyl-CoA synthetase|nr:AMP-binding protein [Hungatella sp.]
MKELQIDCMIFSKAIYNQVKEEAGVEAYIISEDFKFTYLNERKESFCFEDMGVDDMSVVYLTSGTSEGNHKKVAFSGQKALLNVHMVNQHFAMPKGQSHLMILPLHHTLGLVFSLLLPIVRGDSICISRVEHVTCDLLRFNPDIVTIVPSIAQFLMKTYVMADKPKEDVFGKNLKRIFCGGAAVNLKTKQSFIDLTIEFVSGYGMTETGPTVSIALGKERFDIKSCGSLLTGVKVKTVDGEIYVSTPSFMLYYLDNPELTKNSVVNGWCRTGDLGYMGENGELYITGRAKEVIVLTSGQKLFSEELEKYFINALAVDECGIFEYTADTPAIIVSVPKGRVKEEVYSSVIKANRALPVWKRVKAVFIMETELSKTSNGKLARSKFLYQARYLLVIHILKEMVLNRLFTYRDITAFTSLSNELDFDSMEWMTFYTEIESLFKVFLDEKAFFTCDNMHEITVYLLSVLGDFDKPGYEILLRCYQIS